MTNEVMFGIDRSHKGDSSVRRLVDIAAKGLPQMFDRHRQLFCHSLKRTDRGLAQQGISRRYTIITLMGLHRLEESGVRAPIDLNTVLDGLLASLDWVDNIGDLGLLLWLCALTAPARLAELEKRIDVGSALTRYRDAKQGRTMELAWFLSGLSHWGLAKPEVLRKVRDLAFATYQILNRNQCGHSTFGHLARNGSISGRTRGWIGSFADQVYPIYAMTKLSQAYHDERIAQEALLCARAICEAQGPLGQWWWHYDSSSGRVVDGYPVFSVHQHGMGPMTLFELGEATNQDFTPWIYKGLQWINAENELAFNMEDDPGNLIWRCVFRRGFSKYWGAVFGFENRARRDTPLRDLGVLFECRPYELGWLLYAFAGRAASSKPPVLQTATVGAGVRLRP
jgi:hypothetical protein